MVFRHLKKKTPFVYGNNNALLEISSAHNFGACTNVSCTYRYVDVGLTLCTQRQLAAREVERFANVGPT